MMIRTAKRHVAQANAIEYKLAYGVSPLDGLYYVGLPDQLRGVGIYNPTNYYEIGGSR
jgi:hypothetical protein